MLRRLNLGCGPDIRSKAEGWVNMDIADLPGVDVVHDFVQFPYPFKDGEFDNVFMSHVLEHVPHHLGPPHKKDGFILVLEELHRILKPGGTVEILSPHPGSPEVWADPTHTRIVDPKNFRYFDEDSRYAFYSSARFRTLEATTTKWLPVLPRFLRMGRSGLPLSQHLGLRFRFLRPLLMPTPWEQRIVIQKPTGQATAENP